MDLSFMAAQVRPPTTFSPTSSHSPPPSPPMPCLFVPAQLFAPVTPSSCRVMGAPDFVVVVVVLPSVHVGNATSALMKTVVALTATARLAPDTVSGSQSKFVVTAFTTKSRGAKMLHHSEQVSTSLSSFLKDSQ